ncbi:hypothetical protein Tco_1384899 [Tanacetum coccineum]
MDMLFISYNGSGLGVAKDRTPMLAQADGGITWKRITPVLQDDESLSEISVVVTNHQSEIQFLRSTSNRMAKGCVHLVKQSQELKKLELFYADHMNAILGVYTDLDEVTNLQCDYLETVEKCEHLEKELSKSRTMSKSFEALQKHVRFNLELDLYNSAKKKD